MDKTRFSQQRGAEQAKELYLRKMLFFSLNPVQTKSILFHLRKVEMFAFLVKGKNTLYDDVTYIDYDDDAYSTISVLGAL